MYNYAGLLLHVRCNPKNGNTVARRSERGVFIYVSIKPKYTYEEKNLSSHHSRRALKLILIRSLKWSLIFLLSLFFALLGTL